MLQSFGEAVWIQERVVGSQLARPIAHTRVDQPLDRAYVKLRNGCLIEALRQRQLASLRLALREPLPPGHPPSGFGNLVIDKMRPPQTSPAVLPDRVRHTVGGLGSVRLGRGVQAFV